MSFESVRLACDDNRWALEVDGAWFNVARKGDADIVLRACEGRRGRGLEIELPATEASSATATDKVMLDLLGRYERPRQMIPFDAPSHIELSFLIPGDAELPTEDGRFLIFQLWQGAPFGPPLRLELEHDSTVGLYLLDDLTGSTPCASNPRCQPAASSGLEGVRTLIRGVPIRQDEWTTLSLDVVPRHRGFERPGHLRATLAGRSLEVDTYLGFDPNRHGGYPGSERHPNAALEVGIGLYRTRQARHTSVCFDDVVVATPETIAASTATK